MGTYTLKQLGNITGINGDTIRVWEKRYGILTPQRTSTNRRKYDDDDLRKLLNISILYKHGYKISRIAAMKKKDINGIVTSIDSSDVDFELIIALFISAMNDFNEPVINELITKTIQEKGFENAFTNVLFPLLKKVGTLWSTGSLNVSTEHFLTAIIRRKLIVEIDKVMPQKIKRIKKFLLFLPESEHHELGLLFYSYIIIKNGHSVLYLGQSTPDDAVCEAIQKWNPGFVVTGILSELYLPGLQGLLKRLDRMPHEFIILAGGRLADVAVKLKHKNIYPLRTEKDLLQYLH
ncbi:MAG: MerR family transcriptional regulator [Bacteroidales bacterium]|nr:MerR family transcriptional regulator [Bacteroidales bacterium]